MKPIYALIVAVILAAIGLLQTAYVDGTPIGTTFFITWNQPEALCLAVDRIGAWVVLGACLLIAFWRHSVPAAVITFWMFTIAIAGYYQGGNFGAAYMPAAWATRYLAPVCIVLLATKSKHAELVLRIAASATFIAHGIEALMLHPRFVDYIIEGADVILSWKIKQANAETLLQVIGVVDVVVAVALFFKRWKTIAAWMAFWGLITALSRVVHFGFEKWPATLIRSANWGVPLALFLLWRQSNQDTEVV